MLSLSPRYDLFRFNLPKDFLPEAVANKWEVYLNKEPGVITKPIDYLNESIRGISFPGISDINIEQNQHSFNTITKTNSETGKGLGRINIEPNQNNVYVGSANPLDKVTREFDVKFRMNQGLYNYFMIYETIFWRIHKPDLYTSIDTFYIDIMREDGTVVTRVRLDQCNIDGIDGLDFGYDKVDRSTEEFSVKFKFNNIDIEVAENFEVIV